MIKIAIVDDDRNILSIVRNNIESITVIKDSVELHEFSSAMKALNELETGKEYDIIISDIEMEDMQGLEFGKVIRENYPEIFLVFLTAYPHYAAKSYVINAHQYILKEEMEERLPSVLKDFTKKNRDRSSEIPKCNKRERNI